MSKVGESVLGGYLGLNTEILDQHTSVFPLVSKEVGVIIQVVGQMEGQVICSMELHTVKGIVGRMMGGMVIEEMDEMGWSAFQEFGNWVVSGIATQLSEQGLTVNITHPIIQQGAYTLHSAHDFSSVSMVTDVGQLDIYIFLENKVKQ